MFRILAVDDDNEILTLIRRSVEARGHEIETVDTGARFMLAFSRVRPQVVIIDVMMPDIDGIELIRWLRDVDSTARVIVISGDSFGAFGKVAGKLALATGYEDVQVLPKPFRGVDLVNAIERETQPEAARESQLGH